MSKAHHVVGQLAIDFNAPPKLPAQVRPQPPRRPCQLALTAQRERIRTVAKALAAKLSAVPKAKRRAWEAETFEERTRIHRMLADLPGFAEIGRWSRLPDNEVEWAAMRARDVPHGACFYKRCSRTGQVVLIADMNAHGHFEERLDA